MTLKPSTIMQHIKTYLPLFTDQFTEVLTTNSADISAGNILTVSSAAHGKIIGQSVVIKSGTIRNSLVASSLIDGKVRFTTGYDHDLTKPTARLDPSTLTLGGFSSVWDGEHTIIEVPNRRNFEVNLPTGEVAAPAVDGSQYLVENVPTGVYIVLTTPDANTLTLEITESRDLPIGVVDGLQMIRGFRIAAAADFARAQDTYSKQGNGKPYLFVIMTDTDVSKDRNMLNDSVAELTRKDYLFLRLLQTYSTTVFIPTTEDLSGTDAQDLACDEIFEALLKTLFGFAIDGSMYRAVSVPVSMGPGDYNSSYYTHVYDWQLPFIINFENGFLIQREGAFRDLDYIHTIGGDDTDNMTVVPINLDEEQL